MRDWYLSLTKGGQIAVGTISVHLLFLLLLTGQHLFTSHKPKRKQIVVNTVRVVAPSPKPIAKVSAVTKPTVVPKPTIAPKSAAASKPNVKPALQPKPVATKPSKVVKSVEASQASSSLLKEIEQNIASIAAPIPTKKVELEVPTFSIPEEVSEEIFESPVEKLSLFLQQTLRLPEFGEVRVRLSVSKYGQLQMFEVLDAKSEKNAQFLKNQLPELQFPCLNEAVSLTIVFSNEL